MHVYHYSCVVNITWERSLPLSFYRVKFNVTEIQSMQPRKLARSRGWRVWSAWLAHISWSRPSYETRKHLSQIQLCITFPPILHATYYSNVAEKGAVLIADISGFSGIKGPALKVGALPAYMKELYLWIENVAWNLFLIVVSTFMFVGLIREKCKIGCPCHAGSAPLHSLLIVSFSHIC